MSFFPIAGPLCNLPDATSNSCLLLACSWTTAVLDISFVLFFSGLDAQYLASLHWALSQPLSSWDGAHQRERGRRGRMDSLRNVPYKHPGVSKKVATFF